MFVSAATTGADPQVSAATGWVMSDSVWVGSITEQKAVERERTASYFSQFLFIELKVWLRIQEKYY